MLYCTATQGHHFFVLNGSRAFVPSRRVTWWTLTHRMSVPPKLGMGNSHRVQGRNTPRVGVDIYSTSSKLYRMVTQEGFKQSSWGSSCNIATRELNHLQHIGCRSWEIVNKICNMVLWHATWITGTYHCKNDTVTKSPPPHKNNKYNIKTCTKFCWILCYWSNIIIQPYTLSDLGHTGSNNSIHSMKTKNIIFFLLNTRCTPNFRQ